MRIASLVFLDHWFHIATHLVLVLLVVANSPK